MKILINKMLIDQNRSVITERSYDSWGRLRNYTNWTDYTTNTTLSITNRGYTTHVQRNTVFESATNQKQNVEQIPMNIGKHLTDYGIINMFSEDYGFVNTSATKPLAELIPTKSGNGRLYDPIVGRLLNSDPFVASPTSGQDFNRYSYVRNNPLKYTDPSGYFISGGWGWWDRKLSSVFKKISDSRETWVNHLDYIYGRGEFFYYGGFGGNVTFYARSGPTLFSGINLYQISDNGTIVSTNPELKGEKIISRLGQLGYYHQVSGTFGVMTNHGYTIGFTCSHVVCVWTPLGSSAPAGNEQGTVMYDRWGGETNVFYHNHSSGGSYSAPPMGIYIHESDRNNPTYTTQLLQHEHAHTLVSNYKGFNYHYATVAPLSLMSTQVWNRHKYTNVEMEANQFGAMYWGYENWDYDEFPIHPISSYNNQNGLNTIFRFWFQFSFIGF